MARQSGTNDQGYKVVLQGGKVNKVNQDVGKILCNSERESSYVGKPKAAAREWIRQPFSILKDNPLLQQCILQGKVKSYGFIDLIKTLFCSIFRSSQNVFI